MVPVARLTVTDTDVSLLVAAIHPHDPNRVLGLCSIDDHDPSIRWTRLEAMLQSGETGERLAKDAEFVAIGTLGDYLDAAHRMARHRPLSKTAHRR